jgi:two-component system, cell cycle response regulator
MPEAKILIVDDDPDIRRLLGARLRSRGYEPVFASDAIGAVNAARKELPAVILLDLALPGGDGYLVMERLGAISALEGIPVIVVSARDPKPEEERLLASAAAAFFQKPIDHERLLAAIARALGDEDGP